MPRVIPGGRSPSEALAEFERATGLRIVAVYEPDSDALWWQTDPDRDAVFECTIGDRTLHIDELCGP